MPTLFKIDIKVGSVQGRNLISLTQKELGGWRRGMPERYNSIEKRTKQTSKPNYSHCAVATSRLKRPPGF
jgi:hypothetical protein